MNDLARGTSWRIERERERESCTYFLVEAIRRVFAGETILVKNKLCKIYMESL
jgi:hypothetical protein